MKNRILFQMHIMWYESLMIIETLDSIEDALKHSLIPVDFNICLNSQTYIESPIEGNSEDMFNAFINHPIIKKSKITYKTNEDEFYNIGDWRREQYDKDFKYTVWGESDCLLPEDFFYVLSILDIKETHVLSFASRKMWDNSWDCVEHLEIKKYQRDGSNWNKAPIPYNSCDVINQEQLNEFNSKHEIKVLLNDTIKIDGSLLCISNGINFNFIPDKMNFVREDFCAEQIFKIKNIPQYIVSTRIKGHNYSHSKKRTNTNNTRNDKLFKYYEEKSTRAMNEYLNNLIFSSNFKL
jgi:hypothetical protein